MKQKTVFQITTIGELIDPFVTHEGLIGELQSQIDEGYRSLIVKIEVISTEKLDGPESV